MEYRLMVPAHPRKPVSWFFKKTFTHTLIIFAALISWQSIPVQAEIKTLSDLANIATFVVRVKVVRIVTLKTGEQQVIAHVEEQITGKSLGSEIYIWNGDVDNTLPTNSEGRSRQMLHSGEYLLFLEREVNLGYTPCISSWVGFVEIRDGMVLWRKEKLPLADVLRDIPRSGIGPK